ncbi:HNH endonuclease family protein [Pseudokineococcus basanitobsidens]|uniref:HNH endonuclease family protein n=1 Tax=Pseudokineococcus basanitobsidens TaxID=1926649 RepID=A0ABU8RLG5_9ACTN
MRPAAGPAAPPAAGGGAVGRGGPRRLAVLVAASAALVVGCSPAPTAGAGTASAALDELDVRPAASAGGYDRDLFGDGWVDVDGDGCRTREQVLRRDLREVQVRPGTGGCVVESGVLLDPYTGVVVDFRRGERTSEEVQVDHVVALAAAWRTGAAGWDRATREDFANDLVNLLAVDGDANQDKGSQDAAAWLPAREAARCPYAARQVAVKVAYGLWVTEAEHDALADVLAGCPDEPLPTR